MSEQALDDWKQKLFDISTQVLLRRDAERRQIEVERIVNDRAEIEETFRKDAENEHSPRLPV